MVNAAARSHIAATLVFVASVLLLVRQRAGLVRGHRTGRRDVAPAGRRRTTRAVPKARARHALPVRRGHRGAGDRGGAELPDAQRPRRRHRAAAGDGRAQAAGGALAPRRRHRGRRGAVPAARRGARHAVAGQRALLSTGRVGRLRGDRADRRLAAARCRRARRCGCRRARWPCRSRWPSACFLFFPRVAGQFWALQRGGAGDHRPVRRNVAGQHQQARHRIRPGISRAFRGHAAAAARRCTGAARCSTTSTASPGAAMRVAGTTPARSSRCWASRCVIASRSSPPISAGCSRSTRVARCPRRDVFMRRTTGSCRPSSRSPAP